MRIQGTPIIFIAVICGVFSCEKGTQQDENLNASEEFNRNIEVNTFHVYNVINAIDSLLPTVQVEIYSNRQNFIDRIYADAIRTTDSTGSCIFENRNKEYYWLIAEHFSFGIVLDSVSTPPNTTSFVPLLFY
ncbi:MAG: hypothetical protein ACKVPJ_00055 [Chitinophagales bacterium]